METHKLAPDQIVVLSPHKRERSSLKGMRSLGGAPLVSKPAERAGKVLHATISAFKGLERMR